jgi:hypothetical protein
MWDVAYLGRMNGAGEGRKTEAIGLTAIDNLPNIEGYVPGNYTIMFGKEFIPIFFEDFFKAE